MTARSRSVEAPQRLEADAEQVEAQRARSLVELAGVYVRQALALPEEVEALRALAAEQLLEVAFLRHDVRQLAERVEALERRAEGG